MNSESQAPTPGDSARSDPERKAAPGRPHLELSDAANELLTIVQYVTADDRPLQTTSDPGALSPWQEQALSKALERLEVIDHYLRGRVAFFVAGKDHGYGHFEEEEQLARAALDTCRAAARVVDALLARRVPTVPEYEGMSAATLKLYPALDALEDGDG